MKSTNKILLGCTVLFIFVLVNLLLAKRSEEIVLDKYEERVSEISWNLTSQLAQKAEKGVDMEKEIKEAIEKYKEILKENPDCLYAQTKIAYAYFEKGEFDKSKKIIEMVLPKLRSSSYGKILLFRDESYQCLGWIFEQQQQYVNARKVYEKAYEDFSQVFKKNHENTNLKRIVTKYKKLITQQDAEMKKFKANKETDESFEWLMAVFESYKKIDTGNYQGAIEEFEKFKELSHDYPVYYKLGEVYSNWGKISKAIKMYQKQISIDPKHIESYCELVGNYYKLQDYNEARKIGNIALKINLNDEFDSYLQKRIEDYLEKIRKAEKQK